MGGAAGRVAFLWGDWRLWREQVSPDPLVHTFSHLGPASSSTFFWTRLGRSGLSPSPWAPVTLLLLCFPCRPLYVRCPFSMDGLRDELSYPSPSSASLFLLGVPAPPSGPWPRLPPGLHPAQSQPIHVRLIGLAGSPLGQLLKGRYMLQQLRCMRHSKR